MMGAALLGITCAARLMLFVGGPSTLGGGKVVDPELSEPIRSHKVHLPAEPPTMCQSAHLENGKYQQGLQACEGASHHSCTPELLLAVLRA